MAIDVSRAVARINLTGLVWRDGDEPFPGPWLPISSAPRNGRVITVMDPDCMSADMWWNARGTNPPFQVEPGLWEAFGGGFAWSVEGGVGPTFWRPCDAEMPEFLQLLARPPQGRSPIGAAAGPQETNASEGIG